MKALKVIMSLLAVIISMPISLYLTYYMLTAVNASELVWFLYWVNIPVMVLFQVVIKLAEGK